MASSPKERLPVPGTFPVVEERFNFIVCDLEEVYREMLLRHNINWCCHSSRFADKERSDIRKKDISAMLPIIDEPVHTLNKQYHCMTLIAKSIEHLNPGQIAV